jgi:hypothetical protein
MERHLLSEPFVRIEQSLATALVALALQAAGGLCGNTDDVRVTAPDRKHAYDLTPRWASGSELHIECRGCRPRDPTAPLIDGVTIIVISAAERAGAPRTE